MTELSHADKPPVLRPYLKRWGWEVASLMPVKISAGSSDDELTTAGPAIPVFELTPVHVR